MKKEAIISAILDVCKDMGLDYITKVKSATQNADVVVEHNTYKLALSNSMTKNTCWLNQNQELKAKRSSFFSSIKKVRQHSKILITEYLMLIII